MVSDGGGPADDALLFLVIMILGCLLLLSVILTRVILLPTPITVLILTPQGHQTQSPLDVPPQEPGEALHPRPEPVLGVRQSAQQLHPPSLRSD